MSTDCQLVIVADGRSGNQYFLRKLTDEPGVKLARLCCDRVLYGKPGAYSGVGWPRKHGDRFAFKEPDTWGPAAAEEEVDTLRWGQVRLRRWDNLHAQPDAETVFRVLVVEIHRERERPTDPFGIAYQPPPDQEPGDRRLAARWRWYGWRQLVEPSLRFRKQELHWTLPRFQAPERVTAGPCW